MLSDQLGYTSEEDYVDVVSAHRGIPKSRHEAMESWEDEIVTDPTRVLLSLLPRIESLFMTGFRGEGMCLGYCPKTLLASTPILPHLTKMSLVGMDHEAAITMEHVARYMLLPSLRTSSVERISDTDH